MCDECKKQMAELLVKIKVSNVKFSDRIKELDHNNLTGKRGSIGEQGEQEQG